LSFWLIRFSEIRKVEVMGLSGILGEKLGMTQIFDEETHRAVPVTVIKVTPCRVAAIRTPERDGYAAAQLAFGEKKQRSLNKPDRGHLRKAGIESAKALAEVPVDDLSDIELGQEVKADIFEEGSRVDVTGISKGKGFTGVMKRHGFSGLPDSHGAHKVHRAPGSIGACATPGRVFKGTRMAGRHGAKRVTTIGLRVVKADADRGILLLQGSVPGPKGSVVRVRRSVKESKKKQS
jgi:large subunit ribosomal protein L3